LDGSDESPQPVFSAVEAEGFFRKVYCTSPREFQRTNWLPAMNLPQYAFNDAVITASEISNVIERSKSTASPSPIDTTKSSRDVRLSCQLSLISTMLAGSHTLSP
jgi:hypothetical protein